MTPRKRSARNKGLPPRWDYKHNAYYYLPRDSEKPDFDNKSYFRLGKTLAEAHATFAERMTFDGELSTFDQVCNRYELDIMPDKKPATRRSQLRSIARLRIALGKNRPQRIESVHIYKYRDAVAKKYGERTANHDLEVLSHMFTKCIEWGARVGHPMTNKQVVKFSLPPRDRYVTDPELTAALTLASRFIREYIALKLLVGARKGELLSIRLSDIDDEGITIHRSKGGKSSVYEWTPALREVVNAIRANRKKVGGLYLFSSRNGQPYIADDGKTSGFDSIWQRFMAKVVKAGIERFTEHDLRAKVASDTTLERAKELLGHADSSTVTEKVYRRKAQRIKPVK